VNATDDTGATGSATFTWQVTSNVITVTSPGTQAAMTDRNVTSLTITATDSDPGQTLSYTATGLPRGLSISPADTISVTPTRLQYSTVTVTATDGSGASGSVKFTWRVDSEGAIRSRMSSGRCIADRGGKIEIERCGGASSQRWLLTPASNGTVTVSLDKATGTCVNVNHSRTASGTKVVASRCVITSSQRWKDASGGHLTGKHSGKCLTDPGAGRNSTQLEIAACKNTAAEHWSLP
jgi:beta-glucosidase